MNDGMLRISTRAVPVVGHVPAGPLMVADEVHEGWIRLPTFVVPEGATFFLLRVRGDSMNRARVRGDAIENGDLVLVRQQGAAEEGQVVVALIDGEATVKRFDRGEGYYVLKPESTNPEHHPIVLDEDFLVQGVVTRVIKRGAALIESAASQDIL